MERAHIHFFCQKRLPLWPDIDILCAADVPMQQQRFRTGIDTWTIQTYIMMASRLRDLGFKVTISDQVVDQAILVVHRDDLNAYFRNLHRAFIVGIRADRSGLGIANIEIHQNDLHLDAPHQYCIPHWPQPGMIPRDPGRANHIECLAYFGRPNSLPAWFYADSFLKALSDLGVRLEIRTQQWHDYQQVDLVLAHRIEAPTMLQQKPATKLYNAWQAGVPALMSPEPAFRNLRRSSLDYIEIETAEDVIAAIRRLQTEKGLYEQMRHQSAIRAVDFTPEAIGNLWITLFDQKVMDAYQEWRAHYEPWLAWPQFASKLTRQKRNTKKFKRAIDAELAQLPSPQIQEPA